MDVFRSYFDQSLSMLNLSVLDIVLRLSCAFFLSLFFLLACRASKIREGDPRFYQNMILCCLGVTLTIMAIGDSLPRSFGLFAALSLIRFRTPVKEMIDLVLIFIFVGIGIACGIGAFKIALTGCIFIALCLFLTQWIRKTDETEEKQVLHLTGSGKALNSSELHEFFALKKIDIDIKELSSDFQTNQSVAMIEISNLDGPNLSTLIDDLKSLGVDKASVVKFMELD